MNKIKAGLLIFPLLVCCALGFSEAIIIGIIYIIILLLKYLMEETRRNG